MTTSHLSQRGLGQFTSIAFAAVGIASMLTLPIRAGDDSVAASSPAPACKQTQTGRRVVWASPRALEQFPWLARRGAAPSKEPREFQVAPLK